MIYVLMQRHSGGMAGNSMLNDAAIKHFPNIHSWFPEEAGCYHPEDLVKAIKNTVNIYGLRLRAARPFVILTHSLLAIYVLNNLLLEHKDLEIEAYEVISPDEKVSVIKDRWIDESVLGHVYDDVHNEMNRLIIERKEFK